ncbi:MAG TPA: hypothetical protein DCF87_05500, partial [Opitutae bacterium]|nr:hypothetical protein [Opitutae bacterium]
MSQSPLSDSRGASNSYLESFGKLAQRIRSGNSFSGNERNCAFINSGDGKFTDVSYSLGLDLIDDSRGLAVTDLDGDGDPDYFLTNRTAPRFRILRNDLKNENRWLVLKLIGDPNKKCSRDAIGARVEVRLDDRNLFRTLYAGDSFLSQSSKDLRFGIGKSENLQDARVRWPSGEIEIFELDSGVGKFILKQGSGKIESHERIIFKKKFSPIPVELSKKTDALRIRFSQPLKLPEGLDYEDLNGNRLLVDDLTQNGPLLINLWGTWCTSCLQELKELAQNSSSLRDERIEVIALSVDNIYENRGIGSDEVIEKVRLSGYEGRLGFATKSLVDTLDSLIKESVYRHNDFPIPSSFLIDKGSWLTVTYKGPASVDQIIEDKNKMGLGPDVARKESAPFEGLWTQKEFIKNPIAVSKLYFNSGYPEEAKKHLSSFLATHKVIAGKEIGSQKMLQLSQVHFQLAEILSKLGDNDKALSQFKAASHLNPKNEIIKLRKIFSMAKAGKGKEAEGLAKKLCEEFPQNINHLSLLGDIYYVLGKEKKAADTYTKILRINSKTIPAIQGLSWIKSTSKNVQLRDGKGAVKLSEFLMKSPGAGNNEEFNMIIGAAYEAIGEYEKSKFYLKRSY